MRFAVFNERALLCKSLPACRANKRPIARVRANMVLENKGCCEGFTAKLAPELRNTAMYDHGVALQISEGGESTIAFVALVFLMLVSIIVLVDADVHVSHA